MIIFLAIQPASGRMRICRMARWEKMRVREAGGSRIEETTIGWYDVQSVGPFQIADKGRRFDPALIDFEALPGIETGWKSSRREKRSEEFNPLES